MRSLRFFTLALLIAIAYLGQYLLDSRSLDGFFPAWALGLWPILVRPERWLPSDLAVLGFALLAISGVAFGLLAPLWPEDKAARGIASSASEVIPAAMSRQTGAGWVVLVMSVVVGIAAAGLSWLQNETILPAVLWASAVVGYAGGGVLLTLGISQYSATAGNVRLDHELGWKHYLWPALALTALFVLYLYRLDSIPAHVDSRTAELSLTVVRMVETGSVSGSGWEALGEALSATGIAAPAIFLTRDPVAGSRLAGVLSGIVTVVATWLLGRELFRRRPEAGEYGQIVEDRGGWPASIAAVAVGTTVAAFHFSRMPVYWEVVAWGTMGLWMLARGARLGRHLFLFGAILLHGYVLVLHPVGITFFLASLSLWAGVGLFRRHWLSLRGGWSSLLYWFAGTPILLLPGVLSWMQRPSALWDAVAWGEAGEGLERVDSFLAVSVWTQRLLPHIRASLLAFTIQPPDGTFAGYEGALLTGLLAPLLILGVGALVINLDSLLGWTLLSWLTWSVIVASLMGPIAPEWRLLVPALPAVALTIAFGMDRARILIVQSLGSWAGHAATYLAVGVLIGGAALGWITYYQYARQASGLADYVGQAVAEVSRPDQVFLLTLQSSMDDMLNAPAVAYWARGRNDIRELRPAPWPEELEPGTRVLVVPEEDFLVGELVDRYPGGHITVQRDMAGNPRLYVYLLPSDLAQMP